MTQKRLTKSSRDRRFSGVAGGIAEYFDVDPTLVRLIFVLLTLAGGPGILIYFVLSIVLPEDEYADSKRKREEVLE